MKTAERQEEEKIELRAFDSSDELKEAIGQLVSLRTRQNWTLINLCSRGPYLYLKFEFCRN